MHDPTDNGKQWIDYSVMALPRECLLPFTERFLDRWTDRDRFNVRFICHVDQWPFPDFDSGDSWHKTVIQAVELSKRFDDCVLMASTCNQGYGGAFHRILREVKYPLFNQDDDTLWYRQFEMQPLVDMGVDYAGAGGQRPGSTAPGLWSVRLVQKYLRMYPGPRRRHAMTEKDMLAIFAASGCTHTPVNDLRGLPRKVRESKLGFASRGKLVNRAFAVPLFTGPHCASFDRRKNRRIRVRKALAATRLAIRRAQHDER